MSHLLKIDLCILNIEQTAECSSSSSSEETELHPILRTGSNSKFRPIPKLKAKRRQKAKLFLQKIQKPENTRETEQTGGQSPINKQVTQVNNNKYVFVLTVTQ